MQVPVLGCTFLTLSDQPAVVRARIGTDHQGTDDQCPDDRCPAVTPASSAQQCAH
ncbi:unnamed protein product [Staurois parvus]|uniref:Uncharacterized protein n=1 Tax=Staurois parvus TaxID=386267 RepID=A0ABN9DIM2_9NEOB|nr:unnamed protein product [Staurois parvus]